MRCHTQEEISEAVGVSQGEVAKSIPNGDLAEWNKPERAAAEHAIDFEPSKNVSITHGSPKRVTLTMYKSSRRPAGTTQPRMCARDTYRSSRTVDANEHGGTPMAPNGTRCRMSGRFGTLERL